jgi:CRP-like cAMP-binding protein
LKTHKVFRGDLLYAQEDLAEEIYFVLNGQFTVYVDLSEEILLPNDTLDITKHGFNVPYTQFSEASYFGDSDTLSDLLTGTSRRHYRDSTAEATCDSEILQITTSKLNEVVLRFPEIRRYMVSIAKEKLRFN